MQLVVPISVIAISAMLAKRTLPSGHSTWNPSGVQGNHAGNNTITAPGQDLQGQGLTVRSGFQHSASQVSHLVPRVLVLRHHGLLKACVIPAQCGDFGHGGPVDACNKWPLMAKGINGLTIESNRFTTRLAQ
jgi:hypothetical protein